MRAPLLHEKKTSGILAFLGDLPVKKRSSQGFTLVEIILAIGILAFSLSAILALFPVAINTARDSRQETTITQIAQSILADLHLAENGTARIFSTGFNPTDEEAYQDLPLGEAGGVSVFTGYTANGRPWTSPLNNALYENGMTGAPDPPLFVARVTATFNTPDHPGLTRIDIEIGATAVAPRDSRQNYTFVTLIRP